MTVSDLRTRYPEFRYLDYSYQLTPTQLEATFNYQLGELRFQHQLTFTRLATETDQLQDTPFLKQLVFNTGLAEMFNYWKVACSPKIVVAAGPLTSEQTAWWHQLLIKGMGEFFYVNDIDFTPPDFMTLTADSSEVAAISAPSALAADTPPRILIPLGGGKDSIVTLELFKQWQDQQKLSNHLGCLLINPTLAAQEVSALSGLECMVIKRRLDPQLFELNKQGYLNGHVPFSAAVAFMSTVSAHINDFDWIAVSNEGSSNEGNVTFHNQEINHQYSKSYAFEKDFQEYVKTPRPFYFSSLRPLYELQIVRLFTQLVNEQSLLFTSFRSCNRGRHTNAWCGECSKCLFAYVAMYPFVETTALDSLFGGSLFDKESLLPVALELLGKAEHKPFECVGTYRENKVAFYLSYKKMTEQGKAIPILMQHVHDQVLSHESDLDEQVTSVLTSWNSDHSLPPLAEAILKQQLDSNT